MNNPAKSRPFYAEGLRFSCTRCSACCRHESGFVFLSQADLSRLAECGQMGYTAMVETYCRWVPYGLGRERLSLKERSNFDCIFWNTGAPGGCTVYEARPLQCRAFPFWDSVLCSPQAWEAAGVDCPGINAGTVHTLNEIAARLQQQAANPIIERAALRVGGW